METELLKAVDLLVIVAIVVVTEGIKRAVPETYWRWIPLLPLAQGVVAGFVMSPDLTAWRVVARNGLLYAGGASLAYETLRTTILGKGAKSEKST